VQVHVGARIPGVAPHHISPPSTFNVLLGSYWFDKPWLLTEGKLAAVRITPPLGVPNGRVIYRHKQVLQKNLGDASCNLR
jgi:hypothetical protein